jgi:hypothetical protein
VQDAYPRAFSVDSRSLRGTVAEPAGRGLEAVIPLPGTEVVDTAFAEWYYLIDAMTGSFQHRVHRLVNGAGQRSWRMM